MAARAPVTPWRNRIVGYSEEVPDQLLASPWNWRVHPKNQQDSLSGVLREVGLVQNVICNRTTGHVVDGHLRVSLAISEEQPTVPVTWVELSEDEERLILATIDPLSAMAATDRDQLDALLREVQTGDAAVMAMLDQLAAKSGIIPPMDRDAEWQGMPEFEQQDAMAYRTIHLHFADDEAVADFAQIIGQPVTEKTRYLWHPRQEPERLRDQEYHSDAT